MRTTHYLKSNLMALCKLQILFLCFHLSSSALANNYPSVEREYMSAALQGDLSHAGDIFTGKKDSTHTLFNQELQNRFESRFESEADLTTEISENAFIDQLVKTYQSYWIHTLTRKVEPEPAYIQLKQDLDELLLGFDLGGDEQGEIFDWVTSAVEDNGFHASISYTPPLHDLIVWKKEKREEFNVNLTDSEQIVSVVFMDDFASQGWAHFATLGMQSISGWAGHEELYCVMWAYEQSSEKFRVSYLQHEARHFADYRKFPGLDEESLEYRAKLTELAFAGSTTRRLLRQFSEDSNGQGVSAHARANRRIARDMYREIFSRELPEHLDPWGIVSSQQANQAARALLMRNTSFLEK